MKKLVSFLLVLTLCLGSFAGAMDEENYKAWLEFPYGTFVDFVKTFLEGGEAVPAVPDSIRMYLLDYGTDAAADIGFTLLDINADIDPELIFARIDSRENGVCTGSDIIAVFTLDGMSPILMLESSARDRHALLPEARIYNEGSSSAYSGGSAVFSFSGEYHDSALTLVESYNYEYNEQGAASYTHVTMDAAGERIETSVSLTSDEYRAKTAALAEEIIVLTLTPVLDYVHAQ